MRPVRIRAHPVVEVEQHRRALRGRAEQIAELAEHVRPDRLALVLGQQKPIGALARVDVEVVEPEVGEHFLQLPLAVDRAQHFLFGQLCTITPLAFCWSGSGFGGAPSLVGLGVLFPFAPGLSCGRL